MPDLDDQQYTTSPFPELQGRGLRLCSWDPVSDAETWLRGVTDPDFLRWNTPLTLVSDRDEAGEVLRDRAREAADGTIAAFRVTDEASGATLGHIGVNAISHVFRTARVGYWVLPEARGQGVATRALALAAHWALTDLGLYRLELGHALGHEASCRVAERCGFRQEGTLRGASGSSGAAAGSKDGSSVTAGSHTRSDLSRS